jgi:hypothetical protein
MTNVIPLFESRDRPTRGLPHTEATTHFLLEHPANESMRTLCGREGVGYLDKDNAYPACGRCVAEWTRLSGWAFPLPEVVCTD